MPAAVRAGHRLYYRDVGAALGDAAPVLLLMGLGGSGRLWWRLEPHLVEEHRLLVPDGLGTGRSDRLRGPLSMGGMVADVLAVLDAARVPRAHVVGTSLGGMLAQQVALAAPDRVASLVLTATTAIGRGTLLGLPWRSAVLGAARPVLGHAATVQRLVPTLYGPRTIAEHPERIAEDMRHRRQDATPAATAAAQLAVAARHDVRRRLRELGDRPVTVLHGSADALIDVRHGRALAAGIPGSRWGMIEGAGHLLLTDAEEDVARAVVRHLSGAEAADGAAPPARPVRSDARPGRPR
jgi:pimeloyl-ACP methyl ester carboxylesterase